MSLQQIDELINKINKQNRPFSWLIKECLKIEELKYYDLDLDLLKTLGLNLIINKENQVSLKTKTTKIKDEIFCIVDIETTGSIKNGKILEIGAIKIKNNKEINRFNSFIKVDQIPENITELTGINLDMIKNAPNLKEVLNDFKLFLQDSIFVAHNVKFDYNFLSNSLNECGYGMLLNRKLCTIELAKRCIISPKYGLNSLKELLNIQNDHHRALNDAISACEILKYCIDKLPYNIKTTEELINFSKSNIIKNSAQ